MEEQLKQAIVEARTQCSKWATEVERWTEEGDEDAAEWAQERLDEWEGWLGDLECQLETFEIDTRDLLAQRPKAA